MGGLQREDVSQKPVRLYAYAKMSLVEQHARAAALMVAMQRTSMENVRPILQERANLLNVFAMLDIEVLAAQNLRAQMLALAMGLVEKMANVHVIEHILARTALSRDVLLTAVGKVSVT